jgi:hypothetical protein
VEMFSVCGNWRFAAAFGFAILCYRAAAPADPVRTGELQGNVKVRLVAARTSEARTQHLIAKFETRDKDRTEILVQFPAHSFTTHETTLMHLITVGVKRSPEAGGWQPAKGQVEAVFSVPASWAGARGNGNDSLERCFLVSLEVKSDK